MRKVLFVFLCFVSFQNTAFAQNDDQVGLNGVTISSFGDNWFGQLGIDMSLFNPYGENFKNVFPNGKSFGVDVAVGKWFTPEFGVRGKLNWENGILKNESAVWLENADSKHGGYLVLSADILFNLHNLFGEYDIDRKWNLSIFPRMGAFMAMKNKDGSPLLGLGVHNTYRINDKLSVYADAAYQVISSAMGNKTDVGAGSNGFFDINVGVQLDLGKRGFGENVKIKKFNNVKIDKRREVYVPGFWSNWFVQAGLGMSLLNLYGANFANVFPNGKTFGINVGVGKWFSPEAGIRGGVNWQNGIIGNNHLGWMDPEDKPGGNHDGGGYVAGYMDVFFNLHHIIGGYRDGRLWNAIVFPRVGLDSNLESNSASPLVGLGTEQTFRLNDRMKLFVDVAYQFTTGELMGERSITGEGSGSNGWFDLNIGVQFELGKSCGKFKLVDN